ncbi:hypothetical protein [Winogradskyella sp. 3972H.M.0a.05]|uniref:hypothetical protein n=1 Tax=Winogradskyella sp. 3972H.M.0a.05 TaxID=2950277 RepID=UPI003390E094
MHLPEIICLNDFGGHYASYIEAVYEIFTNDFILDKPSFRGTRLGLKKHPIVDGKEYTFYHFTHSGEIEDDRIPDLERCERIGWIKPMINNSDSKDLLVWRKPHGSKHRILIYHPSERFLVVLDDRGDYILPWTAYCVKYNNRHRKLIAESEKYSI